MEKTIGTPKRPSFYYDPLHVADIMRWAREHYKDDPKQPADLSDFMLRAAETLERCVPKYWRTIAAVEALILVTAPFWSR